MGIKSRSNFPVAVCFKKCANKGRIENYSFEDIFIEDYDFCKECIGSRNFKEIKNENL